MRAAEPMQPHPAAPRARARHLRRRARAAPVVWVALAEPAANLSFHVPPISFAGSRVHVARLVMIASMAPAFLRVLEPFIAMARVVLRGRSALRMHA